MELTDGYHPVPPGKLAATQTFLEMRERAAPRPDRVEASWRIERIDPGDLRRYYALFHRVGDEHLWTLRLQMPQDEVRKLLGDARYEPYVLVTGDGDCGLLELDFRVERECEVALFGVAASLVGTGAGRFLMNFAIETAWSHPIDRFWLHTCTLDHPNALAFYQRSGLLPYRRAVEVFDDPRYLGLTRRDAAPHVPIL
ncbi:MAG TPA: GNAT family N-acetyltransferase [Candidatus Binatia bacterium]|nr:GNAT family N-acetyltransferase [Candidatus Binatia bacterium]